MRKSLMFIAALLVAVPMFAQEPAPSPEPESFIQLAGGGAMVIQNGGEATEYISARLTINAKAANKLNVFARGTLLQVQDGGELNVPDPGTFHGVEALGGVRYDAYGRLSVGAIGGFTLSAEGQVDAPTDARLYTVAGVLRYKVADNGYIYAWAGHHGPVGGPAFGVSASVPAGDSGAFLFADYAFPLDENVLRERKYTVTTGLLVNVGKWGL